MPLCDYSILFYFILLGFSDKFNYYLLFFRLKRDALKLSELFSLYLLLFGLIAFILCIEVSIYQHVLLALWILFQIEDFGDSVSDSEWMRIILDYQIISLLFAHYILQITLLFLLWPLFTILLIASIPLSLFLFAIMRNYQIVYV